MMTELLNQISPAYQWLCQPRLNSPKNTDIWQLSAHQNEVLSVICAERSLLCYLGDRDDSRKRAGSCGQRLNNSMVFLTTLALNNTPTKPLSAKPIKALIGWGINWQALG